MAEPTLPITGGCLCGAVRYQAMGEPLVTGHCHCADCRRHNGAPVVTLVIFEADKIRFTKGERKIYQSSPGVGRAFCDHCGTPLTIESKKDDPPTIEFHLSTLDDPVAYVPSLHWYHSRRISWFDVADDLPRYHGLDSDGEEPYRHGPATNDLPVAMDTEEAGMSDKTLAVTGGCLCGAVRYEAMGEPISVIHCHCLSCRRHTGAPVVTLAGFRRDQVEFTADERQVYASSPGVGRSFCGKCGTPLTWEGDGGEHGPLIEILISTTDDPDALVPQFHIHHDERIEWFEVADGLPRFHVWGDDGSEPYRHGPAIEGPPG